MSYEDDDEEALDIIYQQMLIEKFLNEIAREL